MLEESNESLKKPRVLIICSVAYSLINFRKDFIQDLIRSNYEVWCAAPDFNDDISNEIKVMGAHTVNFKLQRKGLNPLKDLKTIGELKEIMQEIGIDFIFAYTIKPVIYGAFAAQKLNLKTFSLITGLGFTFSGVSLKAKLLGQISQFLYRRALRRNNIPIFQNKDDEQLFLKLGIVPKGKDTYVVNGSGINIERFHLKKEDEFNKGGTVNFIIVGRLMVEKGIELYLEAAQTAKKNNKDAIFHIVGDPPEDLTVLSAKLKKLHNAGVVIHHGSHPDVRPFLYRADVFVLPTYYREGVPRSILEALAVGMPIITTYSPGCKETVEKGKNGFLVPMQQFAPLMEAINYFIDHPDKIADMGRASRKLAETKFDVRLINAELLKIIDKNLK